MKKIIMLLLISQFSYAGDTEGSGSVPANSANEGEIEYIVLLCTIPNGTIIDAKQSADQATEAAYTPECDAKASLNGTYGQVVRSNHN